MDPLDPPRSGPVTRRLRGGGEPTGVVEELNCRPEELVEEARERNAYGGEKRYWVPQTTLSLLATELPEGDEGSRWGGSVDTGGGMGEPIPSIDEGEGILVTDRDPPDGGGQQWGNTN